MSNNMSTMDKWFESEDMIRAVYEPLSTESLNDMMVGARQAAADCRLIAKLKDEEEWLIRAEFWDKRQKIAAEILVDRYLA